MKKITAIVCSIAFMLGGYFISLTNNAFKIVSDAKTAHAATAPSFVVPMQYPRDLLLGHNNNVGTTILRDTIHDTIPLEIRHDTVPIVKYKTKWRTKEVIVPDTISRQAPIDTLYVSKPVILMPAVKEEAVDSTNLNAQ